MSRTRLPPEAVERRLRRRRRNAEAETEAHLSVDAPDTRGQMEALQDSVGNRSVARMVQSGAVSRQAVSAAGAIRRQVQRQPKPKPKSAAPLDEKQATDILQKRWGVNKIGAGTRPEQEQMMLTLKADYFKGVSIPADLGTLLANAGWQAWKPASSASMWDELVKAFESLAKAFGGVPPVKEVLFFKNDYAYDPNAPGGPALAASNKELAHYSAGSFVVFEAATYQGTLMPLATGKSVAGAPAPIGSRPLGFTLAHELGHGIVEEVMNNVTKDAVNDFAAAVGWFGGKLYDAGVGAVRDAIKNKQAPDAQYQITAADWKDAKWGEQPLSEYSLNGPSEDFPETVAAFARDPQMLKDRSPRRYDFIAKLAANLKQQGSASPLKAANP